MTLDRNSGARRALDALYGASSGLAALFMIAIAAIVLVQIVTRSVSTRIVGLDDFAAWSMAATVFLALPGTLSKGGHIRVLLFVQALPRGIGRAVAVASALIGLCISIWAARSVIEFVWASYRFGDVTQGELVLPLWLPQLSIAVGFGLLALAFAEHAYDAALNLVIGRNETTESAGVDHEGL